MKIAIGCDPNAQQAKEELMKFIEAKGYGEMTDFGSEDPIYANTAIRLAEAVAAGEYDRGIHLHHLGDRYRRFHRSQQGKRRLRGIAVRCIFCSESALKQ